MVLVTLDFSAVAKASSSEMVKQEFIAPFFRAKGKKTKTSFSIAIMMMSKRLTDSHICHRMMRK